VRYMREQGMSYKAEIQDQLAGGFFTYKDRVATAIASAEAAEAGTLGVSNRT
jgi:hypothetical protein